VKREIFETWRFAHEGRSYAAALDGGSLQDGMLSVGPSKVLPERLVSSAGGLQSWIVGLMRSGLISSALRS
jgi:hypothetical protein